MKKVLWIGDGVAKTGFSTVNHNIISNLLNTYEVHHLAINYWGDPHNNNWNIYPAGIKGDLWGFNRVQEFANGDYDGIFILNDIWVTSRYLELIKKHFKKIPPIVVYFPVDSINFDKEWFINFDIVHRMVVYTGFGQEEVKKVFINIEPDIIPHGVDSKTFYKINESKKDLKSKLYPNRDDFLDSFIVLNANRNQPRKRIDLTIKGFSLFAKNKPENVKLYLHMGLKDVGWDIQKLCIRYGIENRLVVTGRTLNIQQVSEEKLNHIYNATDVGLNTSIGEGWGLVNHEHAITGAPQVVPNHSSLVELYNDCGILIPTSSELTNSDTLTESKIVSPEDVAISLEKIYTNKSLYNELSEKSIKKFSDEKLTWNYITKNYWIPLLKDTFK